MTKIPDILGCIVARKHEEVAERSRRITVDSLLSRIHDMEVPRDFIGALRGKVAYSQPAVIAELKKASPSKGVLRPDFQPVEIALAYQRNGAACLSVLTDRDFFQGSEEYLLRVRAKVDIPIIRKDFVVHPYQVCESRAIGADCILLIAAVLDDVTLRALYEQAVEFDMDVLIEVHDHFELERAMVLSPPIIGINNRNLHNFETSLLTTRDLIRDIPRDVIVVSESGIQAAMDVRTLHAAGVHAFLIGETFMRAADPGRSLKALLWH